MKERVEAGDPPGSIILCGSGSVFQGIHGMEHYGAAKAGLASMMKGMASELAPLGIRVNMNRARLYRHRARWLGRGQGVHGQPHADASARNPEDVEAAAVYLASDAARYQYRRHPRDRWRLAGELYVTERRS